MTINVSFRLFLSVLIFRDTPHTAPCRSSRRTAAQDIQGAASCGERASLRFACHIVHTLGIDTQRPSAPSLATSGVSLSYNADRPPLRSPPRTGTCSHSAPACSPRPRLLVSSCRSLDTRRTRSMRPRTWSV